MCFLDLKKLIEYDRKTNNNLLSSSLSNEWDQSYSARMKSSTLNNTIVDRTQSPIAHKQDNFEPKSNRRQEHIFENGTKYNA